MLTVDIRVWALPERQLQQQRAPPSAMLPAGRLSVTRCHFLTIFYRRCVAVCCKLWMFGFPLNLFECVAPS